MAKPLDCITLEGIACRVRLGVPPEERRKPQRVRIDIGMRLDLRRAGQSDDVRDTVDYAAIERVVRRRVESREFKLVERLAEVAAEIVLSSDARIREVHVAVRKKPAVMPRTRSVCVEIARRRKF